LNWEVQKIRGTDFDVCAIGAWYQAQGFVEKKLKSPSSAAFQLYDENNVIQKDSVFTIKGYVDSQNSFGAMLRSVFLCELVYHKKTETVECTYITID